MEGWKRSWGPVSAWKFHFANMMKNCGMGPSVKFEASRNIGSEQFNMEVTRQIPFKGEQQL